MGRMPIDRQIPPSVGQEVELARTIDAAVARVQAARDLYMAAAVERVMADLVGAGTDSAPPDTAFAPPASAIQQQVVALDGIEVSQAVQDLDHSVPLVAGKATIVRAYLTYPQTVTVRGELQLARNPQGPWQAVPSLGPAQLDPFRAGSSLGQLSSRRADLAFSLNFRLPSELTAGGDLWIRMGPIQRDAGTQLPSLAGLTTRMVTFRRAAPLRIRLLRVSYRMGSPPRTHEPSGTDVSLIRSWLRRAYPVADLELTTTAVNAARPAPFEAAQVNAQLLALRAVDVATGTDDRTHYYGMVANSGFFMRGLASGIPQTPRPGTVASGPTGPDPFGWDFDGSFGDWYGAHELGHTFGRFHAEFCGAGGGAPYPFPNGQLSGPDGRFVGLDVGDPSLGLPMRVLRGTVGHDVMTYCDDQWLSSFTYRGVFEMLGAEDALPAGRAFNAPVAFLEGRPEEEASNMRLIAALNLTRTTGSITAVLPMAQSVVDRVAEEEAGPQPSKITVRIRDAAGNTLDERGATFLPSVCEDPDEDATAGVVDMDVPTPAGSAIIELVVDGQVVDSQPVGGETVPLGGLVSTAEELAGPSDTLDLRWEQPDAPAAQRYIVQVSDDAGGTWRTVAVGLTEPAVTVPRDELEGEEVTVRVLATTGSGETTLVRIDTVRLR